jgi:hypothetical protein
MKILKKENECLEKAKDYFKKKEFEVMSCWDIKKKLNNIFNPDAYLFFCHDEHLIPIVSKNNICYFFGGSTPGNDYNFLSNNKSLINFAISNIEKENMFLRLSSIKNDCFDSIPDQYKKYDVPYNQNWVINNIAEFDIENFISSQVKKRRDRLKRAKKKQSNFLIKEISNNEYKKYYSEKIKNLTIKSFKSRGKKSCWENYPSLYETLFDFYFCDKININKLIIDSKENIIASYNLVINKNEIYLAFSNCFDFSIPEMQYLIYMNILETSKNFAKENSKILRLNAGRGNFNYKSKVGFSPDPMYAVVSDKKWNVSYDKDLSFDQTLKLYKRSFGCFL